MKYIKLFENFSVDYTKEIHELYKEHFNKNIKDDFENIKEIFGMVYTFSGSDIVFNANIQFRFIMEYDESDDSYAIDLKNADGESVRSYVDIIVGFLEGYQESVEFEIPDDVFSKILNIYPNIVEDFKEVDFCDIIVNDKIKEEFPHIFKNDLF